MNAEDFKIEWNRLNSGREISFPLISYTPEELRNVNLRASTKEFLTISGIPESAPPFLGFGFKPLVSLKSEFNLENDYYSDYIVIGSTSGMEFCIDCNNNDQIILFDRYEVLSHDGNKGEVEPYPVNSSISQLAESLLLVRKTYYSVMKEEEEKEEPLTLEQKKDIILKLRENLKAIDSIPFNNDGFWEFKSDLNTFF